MPDYVHDSRQRHSYELRPHDALDAELRAIASRLEALGLLEPGSSTAPRFHPHLTLLRAAEADPAAVSAAAARVRGRTEVVFSHADTFGSGRIIYLHARPRAQLEEARRAVLDQLSAASVDPLATRRTWTPHVTLAYAVPEPHRARALQEVRAALPLTGQWKHAQCWDLDVRPTRLVAQSACLEADSAG